MNVGIPELVIIIMIFGFVILPVAILVVVFRNTRKPPIAPPGDAPGQKPPT